MEKTKKHKLIYTWTDDQRHREQESNYGRRISTYTDRHKDLFFVYKTVDKFVETLDLNNNKKKNLADDNKWIDDGNYVVNL